jgi:hypothetical protein
VDPGTDRPSHGQQRRRKHKHFEKRTGNVKESQTCREQSTIAETKNTLGDIKNKSDTEEKGH